MKRSLTRIAFVGTIMVIVVGMCVFAGHWLPKYWGGGLGGAFGSVALTVGNKWFARLWPKPRAGWAE